MSDWTMGVIELVFSFGLVLGLVGIDLWFTNRAVMRDRRRAAEAPREATRIDGPDSEWRLPTSQPIRGIRNGKSARTHAFLKRSRSRLSCMIGSRAEPLLRTERA